MKGPIGPVQNSGQELKTIARLIRLKSHESQIVRTKLKRQQQSMRVQQSLQKRLSFLSSWEKFP